MLYPVLDRCGIKRTSRADGFHAFRRATSKYLRKAGGLELAPVQLGHKRMTTTDEHYNDRDMDDLKRAAKLIEGAFWKDFAPGFAPEWLDATVIGWHKSLTVVTSSERFRHPRLFLFPDLIRSL